MAKKIGAGQNRSVIPAAAVFDPALGKAALRVLCALGTYTNGRGECWPSVATLSRRLTLGVRSVNRALAELSKKGLVSTEHRRDAAGSELSALRRLSFPEVAPDIASHGGDGAVDHGGDGVEGALPPDTVDQPNVSRERKHLTEEKDRLLDEQFDRFWRAFPRKKDRKRAREIFAAKVRRGADPEQIVRGAVKYAKERVVEGTEARFIKHPTTFLNGDVWTEYQETLVSAAATFQQQGV